MTRPGDDGDRPGGPGGQLIPFPVRRPPAGDELEVQETELVELETPAGDAGEPGDTSVTSTVASRAPGNELEPAGPVYDAELVDDEPPSKPGGAVVRVFQPVIIVVRHDRTVAAGKVIARNLAFLLAGAGVLAKRWWDRRTKYERYERQAELAGDQDAKRYWQEQGEKAKESRHRRRMETLTLPWRLAKALFVAIPVGSVLLLLIGLAMAVNAGDLTLVLAPLAGTVSVVGGLASAVMWLVGMLAFLAPALAVGVLWWVGRGANAAPAWLHVPRSADAEATAVVSADLIVIALQHLGISKLDKAFKAGWIPPFELPPTREGQGQFRGYRAIFGLPEGVTPTMVMDRVEVLAANLGRNGMETWPADYGQQKGGRARHVNLYVADRGVMDKPTPTYPLMHEGNADVFEGVPIGITQRGDTVLMPLNGSNFVFGGRPGQGKSNAVRVVFAGAALDPLCELRVHVFAGNGDFDAYERRLSRYHKGAIPEHAELATLHLEELLVEVERRELRLAELGAKKLTRQIAQQHPDMRPLLVGFSECHELFGDKEHGETAADLAVRVAKRGRKTGVMLGFDTQSSRANAIPSQLVENMGVNGCFSVKTWRNNDGFLGDGSFAAGIRATELRFNVDRGTMLVTGLTEELFEIIRTYFIEVDDDQGWDAATEIIERALAQLDRRTRADGAQPALEVSASRDLLVDVAEVIGNGPDPVRAADVPALLHKAWPRWLPYELLTGKQLVRQLAELGVKVPSTGNRWPIHPATIREALKQRS